MSSIPHTLPPTEPIVGEPFPPPADARIVEARQRIRAALRLLSRLNVTINCYAYDAEFGGPNAATDAQDELILALAALAESAVPA